MKKLWAVTMAFVPVLFLVSSSANADTTVVNSVSNSSSGGNASSTVHINNQVDSSSTSNTSSSSHTHVYTNVNGQVHEYDSDDGGNYDYESPDGTTKIEINNNGQGSSSTVHQDVKGTNTTQVTVTQIPDTGSPSAHPTIQPHTQSKTATHQKQNFIVQMLMYIPEKIFKFLKFW